MSKLKLKFDYKNILIYLCLFFVFLLFNKIEGQVNIFSFAVFSSAISLSLSIFATPLLFLLSFIVVGDSGFLLSAIFPAVILPIIKLIYKKYSISPKYETVLYTALSLALFIAIGNTTYFISIKKRLISSIITVVFSFFCFSAGKSIKEKGLKYKFGYEETLSVLAVTVLCGLGLCNLISPFAFKVVAIFLILSISYLYKKGICVLSSSILGIVFSVYFANISFISLFLLFGIFAESFTSFSRYISAIFLIAVDYFAFLIFEVYPSYSYVDFIFSAVGSIIFMAIPEKLFSELKDKLYFYREKQLTRQSINQNRIMISNRLYDLSLIFSEMASAFTAFQKEKLPEHSIKIKMQSDIKEKVCRQCDFYKHCHAIEKDEDKDLFTLIDIGVAKGKLSLIDLPKNISTKCLKPSSILFCLNKILSEYKDYINDNSTVSEGRQLIASQSQGVSEILKGIALDTGSLLKYHSRIERALSRSLLKNDIRVSELLIYGEGASLSVSMILAMKNIPLEQILYLLKTQLSFEMNLTEKSQIAEDKCYLVFRKSADYDAVFGISSEIKEGNSQCGDTYSVLRLSNDKFLLALSDGMGSGDLAQRISSVSLSLIESFYKANLPSNLILNTVNKLLAVSSDDHFVAIDVAVINLTDCSADFIKYGSPYCFIINESGIKIVESNSLPLGILKEISPSVCSTTLNGNDIVLFVSDGISDAFTSSTDLVEFLRTLPALNPQSLTDSVLSKALELNDGEKKDDMTALAVRLFKKAN